MKNITTEVIEPAQAQNISKNLRILLDKHGVSESEIARSLNLPVMTIRRVISGETGDPRISTLKLIADYFNVSIDTILDEKNPNLISFTHQQKPQFVPVIDWDTLSNSRTINQLNFESVTEWHPLVIENGLLLNQKTFALKSRPSMQPRFPIGTLFVIKPNEKPVDGDIVLIKMKINNELSLRELVIDPPKWQLQPIVNGSEVLFYDEDQHSIIGVVILTVHTRK